MLCARVPEKSEHNCLTSYWYNTAILAIFFLIRVFEGVLSSELVDQEHKYANGNHQKTCLEASKPPTYFTTALTGPLFPIGVENLMYMILFCCGSSNGY